MLGTSRIAVFFQWFVVPDVRKVASLKRRVRRYLFSRQVKNGTPLWREAHFQVKMHKTPQSRTNFWSSDVRKMARRCGAKHICKSKCTKHHSAEPFLNLRSAKNGTPLWREAHLQVKMHKTPHGSDHFLKFRCRKMARRCGAKHICQSKCTKHHMLGPLLEVKMFKNGTPLWREAHLQVKMSCFCRFWEVSNLTS